ncbi:hypothetical protein BV504_00440 [Halomonas sp. 'Soap Lake |nr:hypothetical protein B2G49_00440 [Halomonas sp. 'Soap Lake \
MRRHSILFNYVINALVLEVLVGTRPSGRQYPPDNPNAVEGFDVIQKCAAHENALVDMPTALTIGHPGPKRQIIALGPIDVTATFSLHP